MKNLLFDVLAGLVFLAVLLVTKNMSLAVGVAIGAGITQIVILKLRAQQISALQWGGLALIAVLGGATILTRDPLFVMLKPTVLECGLGATMLRAGWMTRYLSARQVAAIPRSAIVVTGFVYAATMFVLAGVNVAVALLTNPTIWATYIAFVPPIVFSLLAGGVFVVFRYLSSGAGRLNLITGLTAWLRALSA